MTDPANVETSSHQDFQLYSGREDLTVETSRHVQGDAEAASVAKTPERVTLARIEGRIAGTEYLHPATSPHVTICVLTLANGFVVIGKSAPADPENFNADFGRKLARDDAIGQIWALEGYLLRERLAEKPPRLVINAAALERAAAALATATNGGDWLFDYTEVQRESWLKRARVALGPLIVEA